MQLSNSPFESFDGVVPDTSEIEELLGNDKSERLVGAGDEELGGNPVAHIALKHEKSIIEKALVRWMRATFSAFGAKKKKVLDIAENCEASSSSDSMDRRVPSSSIPFASFCFFIMACVVIRSIRAAESK